MTLQPAQGGQRFAPGRATTPPRSTKPKASTHRRSRSTNARSRYGRRPSARTIPLWRGALRTWRRCIEPPNGTKKPKHWSNGPPVSERSNAEASGEAVPLRENPASARSIIATTTSFCRRRGSSGRVRTGRRRRARWARLSRTTVSVVSTSTCSVRKTPHPRATPPVHPRERTKQRTYRFRQDPRRPRGLHEARRYQCPPPPPGRAHRPPLASVASSCAAPPSYWSHHSCRPHDGVYSSPRSARRS